MISGDLTRASILVVDDEPANVELLEGFLAAEGYRNVVGTRDPRRVPPLYEALRPDLILLDLHMPHLSGFEVLRQLGEKIPGHEFVPIVVLTADVTSEAKQRALTEGAKDFLTKPLDAVEVLLRIRNLLLTRSLYLEQRAARERAEAGERRAAFLAEASRVLSTSLDTRVTLSRLAGLAVGEVADACTIDLADREGRFVRMRAPVGGREADAAEPEAIPETDPAAEVLAHGEPRLIADFPAPPADEAEDGPRAAHGLGVPARSLVSAPLVSSGRMLGALTLLSTSPERRYGSEDLALAEDLARRATLAIENGRLFHEAQEATRARDEILAVVAHDLRNPLSTIRMGAALLMETVADDTQRRHLDIVSRSAERMERLIQDLLAVTRLETGNLTMDLRPERIGPLFSEAGAMLRPLAAARGIALEVDGRAELPPVLIDSARILQVISNLVGNAIKFTPEHGTIRLACESGHGEVRIAVADTGTGIAPEQLPHVFTRFWQANVADKRGIGLGLSIARGIVEAHGGSIWVESAPGAGTTFFFTLPTAPKATIAGIDVVRPTAAVAEEAPHTG